MTAPKTHRPLTAGQEIDAWCTRCKLDLGHRIIAIVDHLPKRVVCMTCNSEHNYKAPKTNAPGVVNSTRRVSVNQGVSKSKTSERSTKPAKTVKSSGSARGASARETWEKRVRSGGVFRRYAPTERFAEGDLIAHPKFGEGYVVSLLGGDKLSIAFHDGEKTLVHGLQA